MQLLRVGLAFAAGVTVLVCAGDAIAKRSKRKPDVVLLLHGGGFVEGRPGFFVAADEEFAPAKPVRVRYPLGSVPRAYRHVGRLARRLRAHGHRVHAYGESAGGTIAAWLACHGQVDRALAVGAPTRLHVTLAPVVTAPLIGATARWSPALRCPRAGRMRLRMVHSTADPVIPPRDAVAMRRHGATVALLPGDGHVPPVSKAFITGR